MTNSTAKSRLIGRIETAVAKLKSGTFTGNVVDLLIAAQGELRVAAAEDERTEIKNLKQGFAAYDKFNQRIEEVAEAIIRATHPSDDIGYVHVIRWMILGRDGENEPKISCDVGWTRTNTHDGEDEDRPDGHDGTGQGYKRESEHSLIIYERWLWSDDWKEEAKALRLKHELHMAKYYLEKAEADVPECFSSFEKAKSRLEEQRKIVANLEAQIAAE
jgi:hypothetical protein